MSGHSLDIVPFRPLFSMSHQSPLKSQFPIFQESIHGKPLVYLDNAATSQLPEIVLQAWQNYYQSGHSNVHRGVHLLAERATDFYENSRKAVQKFLKAPNASDIVFVQGTTEAINLVSQAFLKPRLKAGDQILLTQMEHHSNLVPWQMVAAETGATLDFIKVDLQGDLILDDLEQQLSQASFLALSHVSNVLGTVNPVKIILEQAQKQGVPSLVDGAQAVAHLPVDVSSLGCDFYVFSGHKIHAPMGIGAIYGKGKHWQSMDPYQTGGGMIQRVSWESSSFAPGHQKFEAGTPNVGGAVALQTALEFVETLQTEAFIEEQQQLLDYGKALLQEIPSLHLMGNPKVQHSLFSFTMDQVHPHDIGSILDREGIAIRTGHHCAMPLMRHFNLPATSRVSIACYNDKSDWHALQAGLKQVESIFH